MAKPVTKRCFCGAVRFTSTEMPVAVRACWCRDCQYLSCGNASVNAIFKTEAVTISGDVGHYVSNADSGSRMLRRFCPKCGTQVFSESPNRPALMVIRVGALDDPAISHPENFIWAASPPSWDLIDPDLPNCDG